MQKFRGFFFLHMSQNKRCHTATKQNSKPYVKWGKKLKMTLEWFIMQNISFFLTLGSVLRHIQYFTEIWMNCMLLRDIKVLFNWTTNHDRAARFAFWWQSLRHWSHHHQVEKKSSFPVVHIRSELNILCGAVCVYVYQCWIYNETIEEKAPHRNTNPILVCSVCMYFVIVCHFVNEFGNDHAICANVTRFEYS